MKPTSNISFDKFATVPDLILDTCSRQADKIALIGRRGESLKYVNLGKLIKALAGGLRKNGLENEDRVGLLSENCSRWGIAYLATQTAGGIIVPFDSALKKNELTALLRVSEIKYLFCSEKWYQNALEIIALNGLRIELIRLYGDDGLTFDRLSSSEPYRADDIKSENKAAIIYTSGTTGTPKGVILTHRNILSNLYSVGRALTFYDNDIFLSILPLHHTFEATCGFLVPLSQGLTIAYASSLKSRDILNDIAKYDVTVLVAVPLVYEKMYLAINKRLNQLPTLKRVMLDSFLTTSKLGWKLNLKPGRTLFKSLRQKGGMASIRMFISGGAPLPKHIAQWFNLIGFMLLEGYGMTECSPIISVNRPDKIIFGSVGPPLPGVEVEIDNPSADGIGEIKVRGDNTTPGYLDNPDDTAKLLENGWLHTGDLGKLEKGQLYITGRQKNLIVSGGGKNIYPEEIEEVLNQSEFILESLIVGRAKPGKTGEEVWAIIVPDAEQIEQSEKTEKQKPTSEQIRKIISGIVALTNVQLADYKRIVNFEIRTEEFEKTTTRKIKRTIYI